MEEKEIAPEDLADFGDFTDEFCMELQDLGITDLPPKSKMIYYFNEGYAPHFAVEMHLSDLK